MNFISHPAFRIAFYLVLIVSFSKCQAPKLEADTIITNAKIFQSDIAPFATTLIIKDGKILEIGEAGLKDKYTSGNILDMGGRVILPGFIDTHVHLMSGANNLLSVQLRDAKTQEEFINRIGEYAKTLPEGEWIIGGDWDHENWGGEWPQSQWIDSISMKNPVWINRLDGHMSLANSLAMELAGISKWEAVVGGEMVRDRRGKLTGLFRDNAMSKIEQSVPIPSREVEMKQLKNALTYLNSHGVTTVHDMGLLRNLELYEQARKDSMLSVRIYSFLPLGDVMAANEKRNTFIQDEFLKMGGLKGFVDGSLGSHTAAFFKPFTDSPADSGFFITPPKVLESSIRLADSLHFQLAIHAIGTKANHTILNIFETLDSSNKDRRLRIEHAQHLIPQDFNRFAELNVIPSMQPYHAIDDGRWAEKVIGPERAKGTYAFNSLLQAESKLAFGSDWFVAPAIPIMGIYAAVTRRTLDGAHPEGWVPSQKITLEEAIKCYTINGAYAGFDEMNKGSLETGKFADFVILSQDIFNIESYKIKEVQIDQTWVDGKMVFKRE